MGNMVSTYCIMTHFEWDRHSKSNKLILSKHCRKFTKKTGTGYASICSRNFISRTLTQSIRWQITITQKTKVQDWESQSDSDSFMGYIDWKYMEEFVSSVNIGEVIGQKAVYISENQAPLICAMSNLDDIVTPTKEKSDFEFEIALNDR